jgi:hypothetical protein
MVGIIWGCTCHPRINHFLFQELSRPLAQDSEMPPNNADTAVEHQSADNLTSDTFEAMRDLHQQLEGLKEAPQEQPKRRRSRRLQTIEVDPVAAVPPTSPRTPSKRKGHRRRGRKKEEPLMDSQVSDSQLVQVTYDDPEGRREKAKLMARIQRLVGGREGGGGGAERKGLILCVSEQGRGTIGPRHLS